MKSITQQTRLQIVDLLKSGNSTRNTALLAHVSQTTVCKINKTLNPEHHSIARGRPKLLGPREERTIVRFATSGRVMTAVDASHYLENEEFATVSSSTVRRAFSRCGLHARIQRKKPLLKARHKRQRLEFAEKYKSWGLDEWQRVIWSDETKICMLGSEGRKFYWARRGGLDHCKITIFAPL